jgi:translocation and assembly module TamB
MNNISAETLRLFAPDLPLDGSFSGTADLKGPTKNPDIRYAIAGTDLRPKGVTARSFTDTALKASGTVRNSTVTFDGTLSGGKSLQLAANGTVALAGLKEINLKAKGDAELAMFNAVFGGGGQSLAGTVALDGAVTGTLTQPLATGSIKLANGEYRDYARGIRLQKIEADASAQGAVIRVARMTAQAGNGTITGGGMIDLATPGLPVELTFTARNARPLASDLVTATVNGDIKLSGNLNQRLLLSGNVAVLQGEIKIPDKLPSQVAVLDVRRKGQAPPALRPAQSIMALDLTVTAAGRTFVRGRGIDVDLDGSLRITGTVNQPTVLGGLEMRRGTLSIAGRTLSFTSGKVSFDGAGLRNRIDPTLDLAAETNSAGITAKLAITGYASAPRVILSSTPTLAQDEIIARLLFQQSVKQLTPLQLAEIAQAIAALGGVGTGFNPVGALRQSLGLDRLSVGSTPSSTGEQSTPTIDAGKYITRDVYVGATQDLSGRTKAIVEVEIAKNLKAQATVTTGTGTAATGAQAQGGDSIGLSYQYDY